MNALAMLHKPPFPVPHSEWGTGIQFTKSLLYPNTIDYGKSARCGEGLLFLSIPPTLLDSSSTFLTFCPARVSRTVTKQTCVCVFPVQTDTLQL